MPPPRPLRLLGRWLVGLLAVLTLLDVAATIADAGQLAVLDRRVAGEDVPADEIARVDDRVLITGLVQTLITLVIVVVWLVWFYRAYKDLPLLGRGIGRRFGKGWAIGGWFVPILWAWRPKQVVNDIWRASEPDPDPDVPVEQRSLAPLLLVWWLAWVAVTTLDNFVLRLFLGSQTVEEQRSSTLGWLISDAASVPLDLLALAVVLAITRRWEARRERLPADPIPGV